MAYARTNFRTKKAFKEAVANGDRVAVYQPGPFSDGSDIQSGVECIEGPHYPKPHRWYATATIEEGRVVKVT
jgi:hypothetical protein